MALHCIGIEISTLKHVLIFVAGIILVTTAYMHQVDLNPWTIFKREPEIQNAGFKKLGCKRDVDVTKLWRQNITGEAVKILSTLSGLEAGFHKIRVGESTINNNVPAYSHALGNMTAILRTLHGKNVCVFINQSGSGLTKIMNEKNFKGAQCSNKNPSFSNNNRHHTALASYPRSGNTWTRHLLEYISAIHTGAVFNDSRLREVFKGEGHTDRVIAIKTHFTYEYEVAKGRVYDDVILLVRRPEDSIMSFFNFKETGSMHGYANQESYQKAAWQLEIRKSINGWKNFYLSWLKNYKGRMFLLSYTRLTHDFYNEVHKLADFLNVTMTYKTLWCAYEKKEGHFHRHSNVSKDEVYTKEAWNTIAKTRQIVEQGLVRVFGDAANGVF